MSKFKETVKGQDLVQFFKNEHMPTWELLFQRAQYDPRYSEDGNIDVAYIKSIITNQYENITYWWRKVSSTITVTTHY